MAQVPLVVSATTLPAHLAWSAANVAIAVVATLLEQSAACATDQRQNQHQSHYAFHQRHPLRTPLALRETN